MNPELEAQKENCDDCETEDVGPVAVNPLAEEESIPEDDLGGD